MKKISLFLSKLTKNYLSFLDDFKPVSVDTSQTASIEFNEKNKITVTAPNVPGSGMCD